MKNDGEGSAPIGLYAGLGLTLLFVGLKLTGMVAWSWVWVFSPMISVAVVVAAVIGFGILVRISFELRKSRRKNKGQET